MPKDDNVIDGVNGISPGMTFEQVDRILPLNRNEAHAREHGGVWYQAALSTNWTVHFRFSRLASEPDRPQLRLNYPPIVIGNEKKNPTH
jgi:hypothetical protein